MTSDTTLSRLRRANPVPQAPTPEAGELFDAITALPHDPRLTARLRRSPARRRLVIVAVALAVAVVLASTAYAISSWIGVGDVVQPDVTLSEYRAAQHRLTLPPGAAWPVLHLPANSVTGRGAGGGAAVGIARTAWECYWVDAIRNGDVDAQRRAHAELQTLLARNTLEAPAGASENWTPPNPRDVPYEVFANDGGLEWIRATYAAAAAGHPQNLIDSCRANR